MECTIFCVFEHRYGDKFLLTYKQMQEERDQNSDALTYMIVLQACDHFGQEDSSYALASLASLVVGRVLHMLKCKGATAALDVLLGSAFVSMWLHFKSSECC